MTNKTPRISVEHHARVQSTPLAFGSVDTSTPSPAGWWEVADAETVWRVCQALRTADGLGCQKCPSSRGDGDDGCTRGCYLQAVELVNIVQTGNPWRKTTDVRAPWVAFAPATDEKKTTPHAAGAGLEACPFCGSAAKLSRIISLEGERRGDRPSYDVSCTNCGLWRRFDSEVDAVEAWNLRAHPADTAASSRPEGAASAPAPDEISKLVEQLARDADWLDSYGPIDKQIAAKIRQAASAIRRLQGEREGAESRATDIATALQMYEASCAELEKVLDGFAWEDAGRTSDDAFRDSISDARSAELEAEFSRKTGELTARCAELEKLLAHSASLLRAAVHYETWLGAKAHVRAIDAALSAHGQGEGEDR